jgi:hypothetical protein
MARRLHTNNLITIASVAILVGTEILGAVLAAAYAFGSLLEFERDLLYGILGLAFLGGLWLVWKFILMANKVEPIFED